MKLSRSHVHRIIVAFLFSFLCLTIYAQQDSTKAKKKVGFKSTRLYKGVAIESITPNDDQKFAVVKTTDGNSYTLTREELKQTLGIGLGSKGWMLPKDAKAYYYDHNGLLSEPQRSDVYLNLHDTTSARSSTEKSNASSANSTFTPSYILNGKDATPQQLQQLKPDDVFSLNVFKPDSAVKIYGDKGKNGIVVIVTKGIDDGDITHSKVEESARFPGGIDGWRKYLEHNLNYPISAQKNNTQGIVRVQLVIGKEGKILNVQALNDPGDGLAAEAVRVIKTGPDWIPAMQNGRPVTYRFVQTITFKLGGGGANPAALANPNRHNHSIIVKTARLYNEKAVEYIMPTYDGKGADVVTAGQKTYFLNPDEALQQFGIVITDKGFVAPEDATVIYYDNNAVPMDNYGGLKFVGGKKSFYPAYLFTPTTKTIDKAKEPIILLNGKEVSLEDIQQIGANTIRASNLLRFQDEPAIAKFGNKGKNGLLILSTKFHYPDNYLYLLNGKESSNEEIAKLPPGAIKHYTVPTGSRAVKLYGEKAKYGAIVIDTQAYKEVDIYERVFAQSNNPAVFPGGDEGWKKYIAANLKYPELARKNKTEGTVRVHVQIDVNGKVKEAFAHNNLGDGLEKEATRLLMEGPDWKPAEYKGKKVAYALTVQVPFKLDATNYF